MSAPDQRRGVPSASGMDRVVNCPASWHMEKFAPKEQENPDATSGTRIHDALAGFVRIDSLTGAEQETFSMCYEQAQSVIADWGVETGRSVELRLGLTAFGLVLEVTPDQTADFVFTGQADLIVTDDQGRALIIDYKTGRGDYNEAVDNTQLASLAVLVAGYTSCDQVRVAIVQPWAGKPTICDYSTDALFTAKSWLQNALVECESASVEDTRAGDWCKWCKAKISCPSYKAKVLDIVEKVNPMTLHGMDNKTQRLAMIAREMELPAETLASMVANLPMLENLVAATKWVAKERAGNDADFQRFYTLREKKGRRSIDDVLKVYQACSVHGVTPEDFTSRCSIGLGEVKEALRLATGAKGKALDAMQDSVLAGAVKLSDPSFEVVAVGQLEGGEG